MAQINLPADLPENFVTGQIIPANGSDRGQPEQNGYNYLMKQVNAAHQALNNLEASQIPYGKSDLQTIGDALDHVIEVAGSLNEKSTLDCEATYADGIFTLTSPNVPQDFPSKFAVRFIAPINYTNGNKLQIRDTEFIVVTAANPNESAPDGIFADGALVSFDIDSASEKAYPSFGGDGSNSESESFLPPGMVNTFIFATPPPGWLKANGAAISRTAYPKLFEAIGTIFGEGDGKTTFALPDLRGEFIRGFDDGRGIDPNTPLGSKQGSSLEKHVHTFSRSISGVQDTPSSIVDTQGSTYPNVIGLSSIAKGGLNATTSISIGSTGGEDTYPRYMALLICIKY